MKKSLLAIVLAGATLPLTFAQANPPAGSTPDQSSTSTTKATKKAKKHTKHSKHTKMDNGSTGSTTTPSNPPQK